MKEVRFTVLGEPVGKGRPRFSRKTGRAFTPEKTVNYETLVRTEYEIQCGGFRFPDEAMFDVRIIAYFGIPKSASKKKKEMMLNGVIRPTKKPDTDNIIKAIEDALNNVAYKDDSSIVDSQCRKFYSDRPRAEIIIKQIGE